MPATHHVPLFHPRLVRERMAGVSAALLEQHRPTLGVWLGHLRSGTLDETNEVKLHGGFLERIFGDMLGFHTWSTAKSGKWELDAEKRVAGVGSADAALGFFSKGNSQVVAPIELKGAAQLLDIGKGRSRTPIQQGWDYAINTRESLWIVVSNYRETRLYSKRLGQGAYELFLLEELEDLEPFQRFVALLGRDALLGGPAPEQSPLSDMLVASERTEREITAKLYRHYRSIRAHLFDELQRTHSNQPAGELLGYAQTVLDRVLFLAFAEDRGLLPPNTIANAYAHRDPYSPRPVWQNFLAVFRAVDEGNGSLSIPAYNGGLFRRNPEIDQLEVSDKACGWFKELSDYDFRDDVSVDVLGHIFEQSISDLEDLRRDARPSDLPPAKGTDVIRATQKRPSKRQSEGIFYTPPFVTSFLVRETLGKAFAESWERASAGRAANRADKRATWEAYQKELRRLRVLDPACGSGAFLVAAFNAMAQEFDRANRAFAELQDKRGQTNLFDPTKAVLNENLFGVDLNAESIEISRLSLWLKTAERGKRLTFLDRNVRQGNTVVSDPMIDPFAFDWKLGRLARSFLEPEPPAGENTEAIDARWREGFDVVIGNPPYVRQELLTRYKEHWKQSFQAYDGVADLFVYFIERSFMMLKPGGRLGFIVSNKWLRGSYGKQLRSLLAKAATVETIVDFGHAPIFPDADAFPCIIVLRKEAPTPTHTVWVTQYPREDLNKDVLASYVVTHRFELPQSTLSPSGWSLEPPGVAALMERIQRNGVPLRECAGVKPYRGALTGCNEAFLVDQATRDKLCKDDPRSAEILKKYLRGQDVARWAPVWAGLWMIFARRGIEIDRYPAIKAHLNGFRSQLEPRPKDYNDDDWQGRKPGSYKWYELQDAIAFFDLFDRPKILWKDISFHSDFAFDASGLYTNDLCFLLPTDDFWLLACLNSPALWAWLWRNTLHGKDEALRLKSIYMEKTPIAAAGASVRERVTREVAALVKLTQENGDAIVQVLDLLRIQYELESPGNALSAFPELGADAFVTEVKKRRGKHKTFTAAGLRHLREIYESEVPPIQARLAKARGLERQVAAEVHAAYGLTPEDEQLLWATAPPRMPQTR